MDLPEDLLATEEFVAALVSNYLESRRIAIALPTVEVLPFVEPFSIDELEGHRLKFPHAAAEWKSPHNPIVALTIELQTVAFGEGRVSDVATDAKWNAVIRRALIDADGWRDYLEALPAAQRTGWKLLARPVIRSGSVEVNPQSQLRHRMTEVHLNLRVD